MADSPAPALKDIFDAARFRSVAVEMAAVYPDFDTKKFLKLSLTKLDELSLMQRLRLMTECLHETLPQDYPKTLSLLRKLAPRIDRGFVTLVLPDYVSLYGQEDFASSMEALKFFTPFGSSEFGVRTFLKSDLKRTLKVMETWSRDSDEAVRRLASEGCRPRLPWSFQLEALIADPTPVLPILENLRSDTSLYVRKSVANHLNDITKTHPDWVLDLLATWPLENKPTAWIAKHALRTLIKKGHPRALQLIGATQNPEVLVHDLSLSPQKIKLGERFTLNFKITSQASKPQRLVVDYVIHYVKKSGASSAKVFKLKEFTLEPGATMTLSRSQMIKDFTTRVHHAGRHDVEILVNGAKVAKEFFHLG
jgi:3-methyladenine DNA glycosylase AlkC